VLGIGDTILGAIEHLKENFALLKDEPVCIHDDGFIDLIDAVQQAEDDGIHFSDQPLPEKAELIE
jgi:hypothetical protein